MWSRPKQGAATFSLARAAVDIHTLPRAAGRKLTLKAER
jgi:hypothetical protein